VDAGEAEKAPGGYIGRIGRRRRSVRQPCATSGLPFVAVAFRSARAPVMLRSIYGLAWVLGWSCVRELPIQHAALTVKLSNKALARNKEGEAAAVGRNEPNWEDLAHDFDAISQAGEPHWVQWVAYEGHETFGFWLWRPHRPEADEARADFSLTAAKAIEKLRIPPSPIPAPTDHFPHWRMYCSAEEEFARKSGKDIDLSDAVPFGLGEEDRDAVDPCTRAWLELLRCKKVGFKITAQGTETIKGQKFDSLEGRIDNVCSVSSLYCKRLARNEIKERLLKDVALPPRRSEDTATNTEIDKGPSRRGPPNSTVRPREWFRSGDATLFLRKRDGSVFNDLPAHLSPKVILVMDVSSPIEAGDMLIRALPDGLQVGFVVDDPGEREGLGSLPARFEVEAHWAAPIDSREGSDFWRRVRTELEELSIRQAAALGTFREHPKWLRGFCSRLDDDELAFCEIDGGLDSEFRSRFEDIATQAAIALGNPANVSAVPFWVCCLCLDLLQNRPELAETELLQSVPAGGLITHLLRASAAYCSRLAAMADRKTNDSASAETSAQPASAILDESSRPPKGTAADESVSMEISKSGKRRGRRANPERREAIRDAITKQGNAWRDHLPEIFAELDTQAVALGDLQGMRIDLGDDQSVIVSKWEDLDLAIGDDRGKIIDVLRKYV
jgi:hypothetical protein